MSRRQYDAYLYPRLIVRDTVRQALEDNDMNFPTLSVEKQQTVISAIADDWDVDNDAVDVYIFTLHSLERKNSLSLV